MTLAKRAETLQAIGGQGTQKGSEGERGVYIVRRRRCAQLP